MQKYWQLEYAYSELRGKIPASLTSQWIEAILFKRTDGKIQYLILKRHPPNSHPEKGRFWQPITGGLEEGETKREALKREIREETGIKNIIKIIEDIHYYEPIDLSLIEHLKRHGCACKHLKAYAFGV